MMKKQGVEKEGVSSNESAQQFARELLRWNRYENSREMPWKGEKDPYKIWLSEVILQQTRVEQGLAYYQNFIAAFPDVQTLAAAPDEKVFKLWEGLGYYSRCRNLLQTARYIASDLGGVFPQTYDAILALKGVGHYTAAAIGSFAFGLPYAVLDGNVFRVLSRIFDRETPVDSSAGKKEFTALAQSILPLEAPGEYNQAIMDFGATVCKPLPQCDNCFFTRNCRAYQKGKQQLLPIKEKKLTLKKRWLNYFIVRSGNEVLIQQRRSKDIWQGLHQFLLLETEKSLRSKTLQTMFQQQFGLTEFVMLEEWKTKQTLSHQSIFFHFLAIQISRKKNVDGYQWMPFPALKALAFPKTLKEAIEIISSGQ